MYNYINISKVVPPSLPEIIPRPHLTELLSGQQNREVTILTGQAGTGKTTLVASYIKTLTIRSAWTILDSGDSDPINLYYTLVQSLQYAFPEIDFSVHFTYPTISVGPRGTPQLFHEWTHLLFDQLPTPLIIVLDDLESLHPESSSVNFIKVLLEEAPAGLRFILLSRAVPSLGLQKKKMRRLSYVFPQELLAFTKDEIQQFFSNVCRISLPKKTVNRIHNLSEGWVGGVVILSEYLKRMPVEKWINLKETQYLGKFREQIFPYFSEEVFNSLSGSIQNVLLQLSIFDFIDFDFAKDFLSVKDRKLLNTIVDRNLFVKNYDDKGKRQGIRYHNLFREFLIKQLESRTDEDERNDLHKRAGHAFKKRNDLENAAKFYLKAKAYPDAIAIMDRVGVQFIKMNRIAELKSCLIALPSSSVQENPWLLYYASITERYTEPRNNMLRLSKALNLFKHQGDTGGQLLTLSLLIESSFFAGEDLIPMTLLIEKCEGLIKSAYAEQYIFEKAALLLQMGFIYSLRLWNAQKGCWASQNAYLLLKQIGVFPLQIAALANLFLAQQMIGNWQDAEITRKKTDQLIKKYGHPEINASYLISLGQYYTFKGDLEKALQHLKAAENDFEERGMLYLYLPLLLMDLFLLPHLGKFQLAEQKGEQLLNFTSNTNNRLLKGMALLLLGTNNYHRGEYLKAMDLVDASMSIFTAENTYSLTHIVLGRQFSGLINLHLKRYNKALTELNAVATIIEQTTGKPWAADIYFGLALLYRKMNRTDLMVENLLKAMEDLEKRNCSHVQWLSRQDLTEACLLVVAYKVDKVSDYAEYLIITHLASTAYLGLEKLSSHRDKDIRRKVFTIRRKIFRARQPHIKIAALGGFHVFKGNNPMEDKEWQRKNAKMLLKVIIARGAKNIPRDCIIEDLWPEVSSDAGDKRLKVELHRLRKSLEPDMETEFGSSYIHLTDNLISLDEDLCEVDVDQFTSLIRQGRRQNNAGEYRKASESFQKAVNMYTDDFLAQDLYSSWAQERRTELKKQYVETLVQLGQMYEEKGSILKAISCYKKVIVSEPLHEYAYQRIMLLYSAKGKTNQAIQTYEQLKQLLQIKLQSEPEPFSQKLYEKIIVKSSKESKSDT